MIINGKEVEIDFRRAAQIQDKVNKVEELPVSAKQEVNKKEISHLNDYASNFSDLEGFGVSNSTLLTGKNSKENRKEYYTTYQEMSETNFIHRGLQVISDDCTQRGSNGHTLKVYSDDDDTKKTLEDLFFERINVDKELWSIFYETCKLGDNFYEVIPDSYQNPTMVARIRYLEPDRVNRIEKNGKLAFYTYISDMEDSDDIASLLSSGEKKDEEKMLYKLEPWQIIHFKINDKDFYPYGGSLLKSGVKTFKRLQLLEDGMVIYRLARVPERRVFKIDCGNLPQSEANRQVKMIRDNYRGSQIMDDRGNINRTASALSLTQDIFVPVREGSSGTEITSLGPGTALNNIDDIRYFRDQILWTMNIPPEYLGTTSDAQGGGQKSGSLAMQDIKFSRFAERIQFCIEEGLTKIAAIELFFKRKKKEDLKNFKIELTPPSSIKEAIDLEFMTNKMNLIQAMIGTQLFPKKFILQNIMKMSKKEVDDLIFFRDLEVQTTQVNDGSMLGGMAMGGMGGAPISPDAGGAPMSPDTGGAPMSPAASISTESIEEKMVRLFGKDVLIEHKEDFAKLIKAMEEYEKENKQIREEEIEDTDFIKQICGSFIKEEPKKIIDNKATSLIYENELGGLDFDKNKFTVFSEPKKRSGPKTGSIPFVYTEKTVFFNY